MVGKTNCDNLGSMIIKTVSGKEATDRLLWPKEVGNGGMTQLPIPQVRSSQLCVQRIHLHLDTLVLNSILVVTNLQLNSV